MQGRHVSRGPKLTRGGGEAADPRPRSRRPRPFPEPPSRAVPADPPRAPPAPPPSARRPPATRADPTVRVPGAAGEGAFPEPAPSRRGRGAPLRPPPPGPGMAASGSPEPTPSPSPEETRRARRRRLLAVGEERTNLPPDSPVGGGCRRGQGRPGGRAGPGAAAAATAVPSAPLFPFQEDPGEAEPGNQEVPRRDTSCRRYGNGPRLPGRLARDPASAPPAPPASRAAANRRRCGRGGRHLGAARAAPSRRHVRAAPAFSPAAGARRQGCRGRAQLPGCAARNGARDPATPREGGREGGPGRNCRAGTQSRASRHCTKTAGFSRCQLTGRGMAETRVEVDRAVPGARSLQPDCLVFVAQLPTSCQTWGSQFSFLCVSVFHL